MKIKNILIAALAGSLLTGCGLYDKYEQKVEAPSGIYGNGADGRALYTATGDSESVAQVSWRDIFTDPLLQQLIEQVLANNTDLNSARIAIEKSEAALKAAKLAYLPSLFFSPQGSLSSFDGSPVTKIYNLPLQLSWDADLFGSITNKKRAAKAILLQSQLNEEAVRVNLISITAQQYYLLQMLDRELDILIQTDSLWKASLDTQKALWENGQAFSTAVNQQEASWLNVKAQIADVRRSIRSAENSICSLMAATPQHINRSKWLPEANNDPASGGLYMFNNQLLKLGVPADLLNLRPDIRLANCYMEEAFYNTQGARAAFFPTITLTGSAGWTNNNGIIVNPGKLLLSAVASLTQPIFARGQIKANYKIAQLTEEDLQKKYVQTVINAGNQVNEAMADCETAREKHWYYHRQVEVLHEAYKGTHELMNNGKASYIEVLTAQESLLNAQLSEAQNLYDGTQAVIALYIALGGGAK